MKADARRRLAKLVPEELTIASIRNLDDVVLPSRPIYAEPVKAPAPPALLTESAGKLTGLVEKAFDTLDECLEFDDPDPDTVRLMSFKKDTALGVLNMQAKVDDTSLRRQQIDMLPKLLEIISREEKKLIAHTIEGEAVF